MTLYKKMPDRSTSSIPDPVIDIDIHCDEWSGFVAASRDEITRAIIHTIQTIMPTAPQFEISMVLTDDDAIKKLNGQYRHKDKPTNVLSFPQIDRFSEIGQLPEPVLLGDIVLAWHTIAAEAETQEKLLAHHVLHLIIHGTLHLLGFDHENDTEADEMESLEINILRDLMIPNPY